MPWNSRRSLITHSDAFFFKAKEFFNRHRRYRLHPSLRPTSRRHTQFLTSGVPDPPDQSINLFISEKPIKWPLGNGRITSISENCRPRWARPSMRRERLWLTRVWTNQRSPWLPTVSVAWLEKSARRMGDDLSHPQHPQVISALLWIEENPKQSEKLAPKCLSTAAERATSGSILSYEV